jgi:hypothetical protein
MDVISSDVGENPVTVSVASSIVPINLTIKACRIL